ncbi:MAG: c-type cytochrome [Pseudomonadota bacterium]
MSLKLKSLTAGLFIASVMSFPVATPAFAEGDVAAGEKVFRKCKACHRIGDNARNGVGPALNNVVGQPVASVEGYKYGKGILAAKEGGLVWNAETLDGYLTDPKAYLAEVTGDPKAQAKMVFKLRKEEERVNVIAYLKSFSTAEAAPETN